MRLATNWRDILKRAWSVRLIALATILTGLEVVVPDYGYPGLTFLVIAGAFLSRFVVQKGLPSV